MYGGTPTDRAAPEAGQFGKSGEGWRAGLKKQVRLFRRGNITNDPKS
jgi:hypothetical protein